MIGLSIGFKISGHQEWRRSERCGAPPVVVRRGVEIVELSLATWPAYRSAAVVSVSTRTAAGEASDHALSALRDELSHTSEYLAARRRR